MLSLIQEEVVVHNNWMTNEQFTDLVAISQMTPGPIGINTATYAGYNAISNAGFSSWVSVLGALLATFALCLPSFIMIGFISYFYLKFKTNKIFVYAMTGIRPLSIALIAFAAVSLTNSDNFTDYISPVLFLIAFIASVRFKVHPILILALAAVVGLVIY